MIESTRYILLYNLYKRFYDREPKLDINNANTLNVEIQSLVFLLNWLDNSISDYEFEKDDEFEMPISNVLANDINKTLIGKDINVLSEYEIDINNDVLNALDLLKSRIENKNAVFLKDLSNDLYDKCGIIDYKTKEKKKILF